MIQVSVCLPVYNGLKWLPIQIDSILLQLGDNDELIINDDGSTDGSYEWLLRLSKLDKRIRLFRDGPYRNVVKNVAFCLSKVRGEYVLLSDQDDEWLPGKLNGMLIALQRHIMVIHDARIVDESSNIVHPSFFKIQKSGSGLIRNFIRNGYLGCCMGFRSELLTKALPFPENTAMHDIWLGNVAAVMGKVSFQNEVWLNYRRHGGNVSSSSEPSTNSTLKKIQLRLALLFQLVKRFLR